MLRAMVSRSRLKSVLTGLALYAMAAAMIGYFGVNAYTGKLWLNAQQELDQEIIALTSELARLKRSAPRASSGSRCCDPTGSIPICSTSARAISSTTSIRTTWSGSIRTRRRISNPEISKPGEIGLRKFRVALQCGMVKLSRRHAILSWRFELG